MKLVAAIGFPGIAVKQLNQVQEKWVVKDQRIIYVSVLDEDKCRGTVFDSVIVYHKWESDAYRVKKILQVIELNQTI
jgi:hypothetical protein